MFRKTRSIIFSALFFLGLTVKQTLCMEEDKNGDTSLHLAVRSKNLDYIQSLCEKRVDVNAKNKEGLTPLHIAAREGFIEAIKMLLDQYADVTALDNKKQTLLHQAAFHGHLIIIQELLGRDSVKGILNAQNDTGSTALHLAALGGHAKIVTLFIESDAKLGIEDTDGQTPLHIAADNGREQIVRELGSRKTRIDINKRDNQGNTALHLAVEKQDEQMAKTLISLGANVNISNRGSQTPLNIAHVKKHMSLAGYLREHGALTSEIFTARNLRLIQAVKGDAEETIGEILKERNPYSAAPHPHINAQDEEGDSLLHIAVRNKNDKMVERLLECNADTDVVNCRGETPLDLADKKSYIGGLLVGKGAKSGQHPEILKHSKKDSEEEQSNSFPLHKAATLGKVEAIEKLVQEGHAVNAQDENGWTPLYAAADSDNLKIAQKLIALGANARIGDKVGRTPLHRAAFRGYPRWIAFLITNGAEVNKITNDGDTPLHVAVSNNHIPVITKLLKTPGINIDTQNKKAQKPSDLTQAKEPKIRKLFQRHEARKASPGRSSKILGALKRTGRRALKQEIDITALNKDSASLYQAVADGDLDEVNNLLKHKKADVNTRQKDNWTPLHLAADEGNEEIVNVLIAARADINAQNIAKWTPLHIACQAGHKNVVIALLAKKAQVDAQNKYGWTPLHLAADGNHLEVVNALIEAGANVNSKTEGSNRTPLHAACKAGHKEVVRVLLAAGADVNAKNTQGSTALDLVLVTDEGEEENEESAVYGEIAEMLKKAGATTQVKSASTL